MLSSAVLFVPALAGGGASEFVSRTFGAQLSRPPADSIWEVVEHANIVLRMIGDVAHGLLVALAGAFALVLLWTPRRRDVVGLAAACVPVLIALAICDGYFAFDYLIWFVPFTLVAVLLDGEPNAPSRAPRILARRRPAMLASA
jgi:hypothetical protein